MPTPSEQMKCSTSEGAMRAAKAIKNKWSVGTFSGFCDEPADFDYAEDSELAAIIDRETGLNNFEDLRKALEAMVDARQEMDVSEFNKKYGFGSKMAYSNAMRVLALASLERSKGGG